MACSFSLRVVPSATFDEQGKPGFQAVAGVALMTHTNVANEGAAHGGSLGAAGGYGSSSGEPHASAILETTFDYYELPSGADPGFGVRGGARVGLRPSEFPDGSRPLFGAGAALGAFYRLGLRQWHLIGIEGRADERIHLGAGTAPSSRIFAIGPAYELVLPFLNADMPGCPNDPSGSC
jgi:hypothetical protein